MQRSEKEKMLAGELYRANSPELVADTIDADRLNRAYNATAADEPEKRQRLLTELFGSVGTGVNVRPPFFCDYGYNIHLGHEVFLNFGCVLLDVAVIEIGDRTQIGSMVQIVTADHPREPSLRRQGLESGKPIKIGSNVWIGSGAIILPGVEIGDDAIIGAGAVVSRNIQAGRTAMGNPAKVHSR